MTTATATATQTPRGVKMTLDDYLALPEREGIWELVDGVLEKMALPSAEHQRLLANLLQLIDTCLMATAPLPGIVFFSVSVALSQFRVAVPDLVYVRMERRHLLQKIIVSGGPDLVIEVLSQDRAKDLIRNRQWYAEAGIPEYWILDPVNDTLTVLELAGGQYLERATLGRSDILTTPTIPGLSVPLLELFDDPVRLMLRGA